MQIRIGQGIDVHQFKAGRKLILGGVEIPHIMGLDGHSDADALIHAVIDALLGGMGQKDIGTMFPDTDTKWKDADSREMLRLVRKRMNELGWEVINIDSTVLTEAPRLSPYIEQMSANISADLGIGANCCSVKAGTTEKMGFIGRSEGLMAQAVVLLKNSGL